MCIIIRLTKACQKNVSIALLSSNLVVVRPTNSYQTYDLQHACSQSITNVISICRHQFCCNNTKGRIEEEAIMLLISIFRSTSTQPCRNGICKWFSTREWFWCKFKLFFFPLIFIFRWNQYFSTFFSNRTAKRLAPSCAKSGKSPMKANNLLLVDHSRVHIEKKLAFQIILAISSIYYLWALHSDYLHVICAKCEKISYKM